MLKKEIVQNGVGERLMGECQFSFRLRNLTVDGIPTYLLLAVVG